VTMMSSSSTASPSSPGAAQACTPSQASGAPSDSCLGASLRSLSSDSITPTGRNNASAPMSPPSRVA
jgi:hypothetical protein